MNRGGKEIDTGPIHKVPLVEDISIVRPGIPKFVCDCHFHIYDARFPTIPQAMPAPSEACVGDYLQLRQRLGIERGIVVTPSAYGVDNSVTLDALAQLGDGYRGIAVVDLAVSRAELRRLNDLGIRGIRFNLVRPGATTVEMIEPLACRVADLGWHIQIHALADGIAELDTLLHRLPVPVVFDHFGRIPTSQARAHPAYITILSLLEQRRGWVKLSSPYQDSLVGPPTYSDVMDVGRGFIAHAPERVLWGSDWPHPTKGRFGKPDDTVLLSLIQSCLGSNELIHRILIDNPRKLYGFS